MLVYRGLEIEHNATLPFQRFSLDMFRKFISCVALICY